MVLSKKKKIVKIGNNKSKKYLKAGRTKSKYRNNKNSKAGNSKTKKYLKGGKKRSKYGKHKNSNVNLGKKSCKNNAHKGKTLIKSKLKKHKYNAVGGGLPQKIGTWLIHKIEEGIVRILRKFTRFILNHPRTMLNIYKKLCGQDCRNWNFNNIPIFEEEFSKLLKNMTKTTTFKYYRKTFVKEAVAFYLPDDFLDDPEDSLGWKDILSPLNSIYVYTFIRLLCEAFILVRLKEINDSKTGKPMENSIVSYIEKLLLTGEQLPEDLKEFIINFKNLLNEEVCVSIVEDLIKSEYITTEIKNLSTFIAKSTKEQINTRLANLIDTKLKSITIDKLKLMNTNRLKYETEVKTLISKHIDQIYQLLKELPQLARNFAYAVKRYFTTTIYTNLNDLDNLNGEELEKSLGEENAEYGGNEDGDGGVEGGEDDDAGMEPDEDEPADTEPESDMI